MFVFFLIVEFMVLIFAVRELGHVLLFVTESYQTSFTYQSENKRVCRKCHQVHYNVSTSIVFKCWSKTNELAINNIINDKNYRDYTKTMLLRSEYAKASVNDPKCVCNKHIIE